MRFTKVMAILLLLIFITGSGCVKDSDTGVKDDIVEDVPDVIPEDIVVEEPAPIPAEKVPEKVVAALPTPNVMGVFYSNGIVSLKVDKVRVIDRVAHYATLVPTSGNMYVEVQVQIRNDQNKPVSVDTSQFTLVDSERYINTIDANQRYLSEKLEDLTLAPLSKANGSLLFQVSKKRGVSELIYNGEGDSIVIEISLPEEVPVVAGVPTGGLSVADIESGILRSTYYGNIQFDEGVSMRIIKIEKERPNNGITRVAIKLKVENVNRAKLTQDSDFAILANGVVYQDVASIIYSEYDPNKEAVVTIAIPGNLGDNELKGSKFAVRYGDTVGVWPI